MMGLSAGFRGRPCGVLALVITLATTSTAASQMPAGGFVSTDDISGFRTGANLPVLLSARVDGDRLEIGYLIMRHAVPASALDALHAMAAEPMWTYQAEVGGIPVESLAERFLPAVVSGAGPLTVRAAGRLEPDGDAFTVRQPVIELPVESFIYFGQPGDRPGDLDRHAWLFDGGQILVALDGGDLRLSDGEDGVVLAADDLTRYGWGQRLFQAHRTSVQMSWGDLMPIAGQLAEGRLEAGGDCPAASVYREAVMAAQQRHEAAAAAIGITPGARLSWAELLTANGLDLDPAHPWLAAAELQASIERSLAGWEADAGGAPLAIGEMFDPCRFPG